MLLFPYGLPGQDIGSTETYSTKDGIPHPLISDIIQDQKGFIWLSTFGGICKFDGYKFYAYRPTEKDNIQLDNNRVNEITSDKYGRIWMTGLDSYSKVCCFDPKTESFWSSDELKIITQNNKCYKIIASKSGPVWLLTEKKGAVCVADSLYSSYVFLQGNEEKVNDVFEDSRGNFWLLKNQNGITLINHGAPEKKEDYFNNDTACSQSYYAAIEMDENIYFGGERGIIAQYSKTTKRFSILKLPLSSKIINLFALDEDRILAVTFQKGLVVMDKNTGAHTIYDASSIKNMPTQNLETIAFTDKNKLWFVSGYERKMNLLDFDLNALFQFRAPPESNDYENSNDKSIVSCNENGQIWVQVKGGKLSHFNAETYTLEPLPVGNLNTKGKSGSYRIAFPDKQGNLWLHQYYHGLIKINFYNENFHSKSIAYPNNSRGSRTTRALFQDSRGFIWVGDRKNQLTILDDNFAEIGKLSTQGKLSPQSNWGAVIYSIFEDKNKNIWIGTKKNGLFCLKRKNKIHNFDFEVEHYAFSPNDTYSISSNEVYDITEDKHERLWIATFDGLNLLSKDKNGSIKFINYRNDWIAYPTEEYNRVRCIKELPNGLMAAGTTSGLIVFDPGTIRSSSMQYKTFKNIDYSNNYSNSSDVIDICINKNKDIFFAAESVCKVAELDSAGFPLSFVSYGPKEGLPSPNIVAMSNDLDGNIWVASHNMLSLLFPQNGYFETFNDIKRVVNDGFFVEATSTLLNSGEVVFGYSNGLLHFMPEEVKTDSYSPYLSLSNFQIFNKAIHVSNNSILKTSIDETSELQLKHDQNFINIAFAALDYSKTANLKYAYILEGFDEEWNYIDTKRNATYTNIPPGKYTFKVKSTNSHNIWCNNERHLNITIKPPFGKTKPAYILYFILLIIIITAANLLWIYLYKLKENVKNEKLVSDLKMKFFIDVSHEIRTPLTMITAPVEHLIADAKTPDYVKKQLEYVSHNTQRMLHLANQILDYRKMQKITLRVSETPLADFVRNIYQDFEMLAKEKNITLKFENHIKNDSIWVDQSSLDKILMNLLSNAFKFTPKGKSITIRLIKDNVFIGIQVIDEGIGIAPGKLPKLFNRFIAFNEDNNNPSTGIGLSLVRELVEKHNGEVKAISTKGKGSTFTVLFRQGKKHFATGVNIIENGTPEGYHQGDNIETGISEEDLPDDTPKVLVVEDDDELRSFMRSILSDAYQVIETSNGQLGLEVAIEQHPDFIISDIMMPVMDGIEFLRNIRSNVQTSHLPVILLTAKANIESRLEGLSYGADDYITKPFNIEYFKARVENLISQRKRLQRSFSTLILQNNNTQPPYGEKEKESRVSEADEEMMKNIASIIEKNLSNDRFSVPELAAAVGTNRTTLSRKVKSLTGVTPVKLIRDFRLEYAANMLISDNILVKEVAACCGFYDLKYFGECFKTKFEMTPVEYRKMRSKGLKG